MPIKDPLRVPAAMQARYNQIVQITEGVCNEHLTPDHADLSRKMAAALARKRPSPLASGRPNSWACGIVYVLGQVNFLFDKANTPYLRADELCMAFGLAASTGSAMAKRIRDLLKIDYFSHEWMLPERQRTSSGAWLIMVNGLIVDARQLPRELQEIAFAKGLIPYIPDDQ